MTINDHDPPVTATPTVDRPQLPEGYGVPQDDDGLLPWSWATERLTDSKNYWFSTTRPDGRPHAMPAWGVWLGDAFYFDGSPQTRRGRNLAQNSAISIHLESGDEVVIIEGTADEVGTPPPQLVAKLVAAITAKYEKHGYVPAPDTWDNGGLWRVRPRVAFGWDAFPKTMTRWRFEA